MNDKDIIAKNIRLALEMDTRYTRAGIDVYDCLERDDFREMHDLLLATGISEEEAASHSVDALAILHWLYTGLTVVKLSMDDLMTMNDLAESMDGLAGKGVEIPNKEAFLRRPFDSVMYLLPTLMPADYEDKRLGTIACIVGNIKTYLDSPYEGIVVTHDGKELHDGYMSMSSMEEEDKHFLGKMNCLLNFTINSFSLKERVTKSKGVKNAGNRRRHGKWVKPKIWLPHEPKVISPGSSSRRNSTGVHLEGSVRKGTRMKRHPRIGYFGLRDYGPRKSKRRFSWIRPTIVNKDCDTFSTGVYSKKGDNG